MKSWKHISRGFKKHPVLQISTIMVLVGCYLFISLVLLAYQNLNQIFGTWENQVQLSVYLNDKVSKNQLEHIKESIKDSPGVQSMTHLLKEDAGNLFKKQIQNYAPHLVKNLDVAQLLPSSIEVFFGSTGGADSLFSELSKLQRKIEAYDGVEEVAFGRDWIENYSRFISKYQSTGWLLVLILIGGSCLIIGNSIRTTIHQRKNETEVLELIGATRSMIRSPFLIEGGGAGLIASIISLLLCKTVFVWQTMSFQEAILNLNLENQILFFSTPSVLSLLFMGTLLGVLGAFLCFIDLKKWSNFRGRNLSEFGVDGVEGLRNEM